MTAKAELIAALPSELAALVEAAFTVRSGGGRLVLTACHPAWIEVANRVIAPVANALAQQRNLHLVITSRRGGDLAASLARLADLLADPGNRLALAACQRVVAAPGVDHNPLVIHGPPGSGKSALLTATCGEIRAAVGPDSVREFTGETLINRAGILTAGGFAELESVVLVAVDGIDPIAARPVAQEALFQLINTCLDRGVQIMLTARQGPGRLGLAERVASRLAWGLVIDVEVPTAETRTALLRRLAGSAVSERDPAAIANLVDRHAPDGHQVAMLAQRLLAGEQPHSASVSFDVILTAVAEHFSCRPTDITGPRRNREWVRARQMTLLLARRLTAHNLTALGGMVGGRDHATVIHAINEAEARLPSDPDWQRAADTISARVLA